MKKRTETNEILWTPSSQYIAESNLQDYMIWLENNYKYHFESYEELWDWSVSAVDEFWESILEYYHVHYDGKYTDVQSSKEMPYTRWFEGIKLSFSEHIFRNYTDDYPAIIYKSENSEILEISWQDLVAKVSSLKEHLTQIGIEKGDRVVAYISNGPEAIISFLAVNSLGAVWSSASPDFGVSSVTDRFSQVEAKVLIASTSYSYNGKKHDKIADIKLLTKSLTSLEELIIIGESKLNVSINISTWEEVMSLETEELTFERVDFSDPIWVLYSSGTSGQPKAITHSVGGILLEHLKILGLHNNIKDGDKFFWYTTTGWMMWNYMLSSLLHGATIVLYDGSPTFPKEDFLWEFAEKAEINHLGLGAAFINSCMKKALEPGTKFSLKNLITIGSTGSPLSEDSYKWIYDAVSSRVHLCSISGGSDVCSAFVGPVPFKSVSKGEIQARALGCDLAVFNEAGEEIYNEIGEMVVKRAMPSMPIYFWNDKDFKRYKESYFEYFPNVWRHGDWTEITDRDSVIISGRSDSTLNRGGIRIGSSEIYKVVEKIDGIKDSLVVSTVISGKDEMILFVASSKKLDDKIIEEIKSKLRKECSPRHVPNTILEVSEIPYTLSGKKIEKPIKELISGNRGSISLGSLKNPKLIEEFEEVIKKALE